MSVRSSILFSILTAASVSPLLGQSLAPDIDRGVAATLWVLPASFLRELDLELFATGAIDRRQDLHAATGAAITLRLELLRVPLRVAYQIARRVRDDEALTQLVGFALEL